MENLLCGVIMEDEASFSFWRYAPVYVFGFVWRDYGGWSFILFLVLRPGLRFGFAEES